jgi:dihydroorotase
VIRRTTVNAAMALKRHELGSLKPGSAGDATILSVREGKFDYVDVVGEHLTGDRKILSEGVVIAGRWWHPKRSQKFANRNARSRRQGVAKTPASAPLDIG